MGGLRLASAIIARALVSQGYYPLWIFPSEWGPPLGGRAGERVARMLLAFCPFVPFHLYTSPIGVLLLKQ